MSRPWMKFYPNDWRGDPRLRRCSFSARGLWIDLMTYMHEAKPYGHFLIDGESLDITSLGLLLGRPSNETKKALEELESFGVFSRTEKGIIYSRRMVRDSDKADQDRTNGKRGGNPRLYERDNRGVNPPDNPPLNREDKPPDNGEVKAHWSLVSSSSATSSNLEVVEEERSSGRKKQKTPLPPDFEPDREYPRRLSWPDDKIDQQIQYFFDSARAHDRRYVDWQAAWRNWCNSPYQAQNQGVNGHGKSGKSILDAIDRLQFGESGTDQTAGENPVLGLPTR